METQPDKEKETRERVPTEKGRLYNLQLRHDERSRNLKALELSSNELHKLLLESKEIEIVKHAYTKWIAIYDKTLEIHDKYQQLLLEDHEKHIDDAWFKTKVTKCDELNKMVQQYFTLKQVIKPLERTDQYEVKSGVSQTSRRSNGSRKSDKSSMASNLSAAKFKEEQRKAELLARSQALAEKQRLEEEKLKLRMKEEELEIRTEFNVSDAKVKVIEVLEKSMLADQETEDQIKDEQAAKPETFMHTLNPDVPEWVPNELKRNDNNVNSEIQPFAI